MAERRGKPGDDFPTWIERGCWRVGFFCHKNLKNQIQTKAKQRGCGTHINLISLVFHWVPFRETSCKYPKINIKQITPLLPSVNNTSQEDCAQIYSRTLYPPPPFYFSHVFSFSVLTPPTLSSNLTQSKQSLFGLLFQIGFCYIVPDSLELIMQVKLAMNSWQCYCSAF